MPTLTHRRKEEMPEVDEAMERRIVQAIQDGVLMGDMEARFRLARGRIDAIRVKHGIPRYKESRR